jgi:mannose-6-phosphate isomerase-like protein (cupin superfamily)
MASAATKLGDETVAARPAMKVTVSSAKTPQFAEGRRSFFKYRDLGVGAATDGWMRAQVTSAITGMTKPTGWHYHVCEGQFVYTLRGWVELEFADGSSCRLEAGDSCFIPGGTPHNEISTSDDLEILEVSVPAAMGTVPCESPTAG